MNIVVLTGNFLANKSANSSCIENIFCEWKNQGDIIYVICPSESDNILTYDPHEMVYSFASIHKKSWVECTRFSEKIKYILLRIKDYYRYPRTDHNLIDRYHKVLELLDSEIDIDLVVSVCNPPETVETAYSFLINRKSTKWIIYDIDTVSNCSHGSVDRYIKNVIKRKALKWEIKMFSRADLIVHLPQHSKHFDEQSYRDFSCKMIVQELPLLKIHQSKAQNEADNKAQMIYAGRFYPGMRDPDLILPLLLETIEKSNMKLQVYTDDGYCKRISEKYHENKNLIVSNYISQEKLRRVIDESNFLISLGNKGTEMFPSKIVTYVGSCKPIIHFYQDERDPVIDFLSEYPDKLLVDLNGSHIEIVDVLRTYISIKHKSINRNEILAIFEANTPKKNAIEMKEYLND